MSVAAPRRVPRKAVAKKATSPKRSPRRRARPIVVRASTASLAGLVWGVLLVLAFAISGVAVAVVVLPVAGVAALSARRSNRRRKVATWKTRVAVLAPLEVAGCLLVARGQGASLGLALTAAALAFDAGSFVMGNGRGAFGGAAGVAGGVASVAVVAVFVAAIMNPPFSGYRPWAVFALVAALMPTGVKLCETVTAGSRLPAMRRLDSLVLAAPAWIICVALLTNR